MPGSGDGSGGYVNVALFELYGTLVNDGSRALMRRALMMAKRVSVTALMVSVLTVGSVPIAAQWPSIPDPKVPRDSKGDVRGDAPTPRTPDGKPDFSGL